jgi:hypothetical protein
MHSLSEQAQAAAYCSRSSASSANALIDLRNIVCADKNFLLSSRKEGEVAVVG